MRLQVIAACAGLLVAGCGKNDNEGARSSPPAAAAVTDGAAAPPAQPPTAPATPAAGPPTALAAPAARPAVTPGAGETFAGDRDDINFGSDNPIEWKTKSGDVVALGILFRLGEPDGVARVVTSALDAAGKPVVQAIGQVELNLAYGHAATVRVDRDGQAVASVQEMGGSGDPGFLHAWLLRWDPAARKVVVAEEKEWPGTDDYPGWAAIK